MKIVESNGRTRIFADEGKRVTNGDGVYALYVALAVGSSPDGYTEITEEEYQKIVEERNAEN